MMRRRKVINFCEVDKHFYVLGIGNTCFFKTFSPACGSSEMYLILIEAVALCDNDFHDDFKWNANCQEINSNKSIWMIFQLILTSTESEAIWRFCSLPNKKYTTNVSICCPRLSVTIWETKILILIQNNRAEF